ncbi:hypothetical protein ACT453_29905 [Bacillus sp. D-CC]
MTNQRETTVVWDKTTSKPIYNRCFTLVRNTDTSDLFWFYISFT